MAKPRRSRQRFVGSEPFSARLVDDAVDDQSVETRLDGPTGSSGIRPGRIRTSRPSMPALSMPQKIQTIAAFAPLWELAAEIDAPDEGQIRMGRPPEVSAAEMLLFSLAAWITGSGRSAEVHLKDPVQWRLICDAVAQAYPNDLTRRLTPRGITRGQFARYRRRNLEFDGAIEHLKSRFEEVSIEIALAIGMCDVDAGTVTKPATQNMACGDGTWIPSLFNSSQPTYVDYSTGEIINIRHDPDSVAYRDNTQANGNMLVSITMRNPYPNERVILAMDFKPHAGVGEATVATDMTLGLAQRLPGLQGLVYDMALHATDYDRLLTAGLIAVSKTQRTKTGKVATFRLGDHEFTRTDGSKVALNVQAIDGTPCIPAIIEEEASLIPLIRVKINRIKNRGDGYRIYTTWLVPDLPGVDRRLRGAICSIRHTSTSDEVAEGRRRTRALRVIPESDADFDRLAGLREDIESMHHHLKSRLPNRRARSVGRRRQLFDLCAYQANCAITALIAWHNRTGGDISRWFGEWRPPNSPVVLAA